MNNPYTTEYPTQSGWYWWRHNEDSEEEIVQVVTGWDGRLCVGLDSFESLGGLYGPRIPTAEELASRPA